MDRHNLPTGNDLNDITGQQLQHLPADVCKAKAASLLLQAEQFGESHRREHLLARAAVWAQLATAAAITEQTATRV